jgi:hypothetical protein
VVLHGREALYLFSLELRKYWGTEDG